MNLTTDYPLLEGYVFVREAPLAEDDWHRILRRARPSPFLRIMTWAVSIIMLVSFPVSLLVPSVITQAWVTFLIGMVLSVYVYLPYRDQRATARHLGEPVKGNLEYRSEDGRTVIEFLAGPDLAWKVNGRVARNWTHLTPQVRPTNPDRAESDYSWANGDIDRRTLTSSEAEELAVHLSVVRKGVGWYDVLMPLLCVIFMIVTVLVPFDDAGGRTIFGLIAGACLIRTIKAAKIWRFYKLLHEDVDGATVSTLVGSKRNGAPVLVEYLPKTGIVWRVGLEVASWRHPNRG